MFDAITTELIQGAPRLEGLNRDRLPQMLTDAFASIVAFRVRLRGRRMDLPVALVDHLNQFQRMATTLESLVALLPARADRASAAYVAAQAHHLLLLSRIAAGRPSTNDRHLRAEAISPEVSALLLFLIANQPSDATDAARAIASTVGADASVESALARALVALVRGELQAVETEQSVVQQQTRGGDLLSNAGSALYRRVLDGVALLAVQLRGIGEGFAPGVEPIDVFREVQRLAVEPLAWPDNIIERLGQHSAFTTFPGPHHLASLLISASDHLLDASVARLASPSDVPRNDWHRVLRPIIERRPFLWRNHQEAVAKGLLDSGVSAVSSFPTGAGKTTLAELKATATLAAGGSVLYLAPTHALVAQTKQSLAASFPGFQVRDSLVMEDFYAEVDEELAKVAVMTPERCLALIGTRPESFHSVRLIIFDECHLLHPKGPGQNRRSLDAMLTVLFLASAAPEADWLLLSAMMANPEELADWISELTHRRCVALNLNWKPTRQARACLVYDQTEIEQLNLELNAAARAARRKPDYTLPSPSQSLKGGLRAVPSGFFCLLQTWQTLVLQDYALIRLLDDPIQLSAGLTYNHMGWKLNPNKNDVAAHIAAECSALGLKVLIFAQNKDHTSSIAKKIGLIAPDATSSPSLSASEQRYLRLAIDEAGALEQVYFDADSSAGCHHSLMLPVERELVESMFRRPDGLQSLAATPTLAQGMNLPADIVLIVGTERFDVAQGQSAPIAAHEVLNAAGRAGRAGQVAQGIVVIVPDKIVTFDPRTAQIGQQWSQLRQSIFAQSDQCLEITDPINAVLDLVQDQTHRNLPDVQYLLLRIPVPTREDTAAPARFLRSSLAAYHARRSGEEAIFEAKIAGALRMRDEALREPGVTWQADLASRSGVPIEMINELDEALLTLSDVPTETAVWLQWFLTWMSEASQRSEAILSQRVLAKVGSGGPRLGLFTSKLFDLAWAWMTCATLTEIEVLLHGDSANLRKCKNARHFVLSVIPELAFAVGLIPQVFRSQLGGDPSRARMPLVLGTLALCVREGCEEPEIAAVRHHGNGLTSRQEANRIWRIIENRVQPREDFETFTQTRRRVATALTTYEHDSL